MRLQEKQKKSPKKPSSLFLFIFHRAWVVTLFFSKFSSAINIDCQGPGQNLGCLNSPTYYLTDKIWDWKDQSNNFAQIKIIGGHAARIWWNGQHLGDFPASLISGRLGRTCSLCGNDQFLEANLWILIGGHNYRVRLYEVAGSSILHDDWSAQVTIDGYIYRYTYND